MIFKHEKFAQFVDVETTGFDPFSNSVISMAVIVADIETGEIADKFVGYAQPESKRKWSSKAEEIHGFSYSEAMEFPTQRQTAIEYLKFMKQFKHPKNLPMDFYYHGNGNFDWRFVNAMMSKQDLLFSFRKISKVDFVHSTVKLAKKKMALNSYKLNVVSERLGIDLDHHEVESDAMACYGIWKKLSGVGNAQI